MFKRWCQDQGYANSRDLSHVLMDGGVLSIPFDKLHAFYDQYVRCVKMGEKLYVVEQKTPTYNFFMDIDYKEDTHLSLEQIKSITLVICNTVNGFGGRECIISIADPKPKDDKVKTGIHLNWPGLIVDQMNAIQLMHHVVSALNKIYSVRDWSKDIDASVYGSIGTKGSGFRLPWSHKKSKHTVCNGVGCVACDNGKLIEGEYLPRFVFKNGTFENISREPSVAALLSSTVRTEDTRVVTVPELVLLCRPVKKEGDFTASELKNEVVDYELLALLETFIRQNMQGHEHTRLQNVFHYKTCHLIKTSSKYCENIRREHNSNHIRFRIDSGGIIYQQCFCRCDTLQGRLHGMCKNFTGRKHQLSRKICALLYELKK
jgi:hypothetical protein